MTTVRKVRRLKEVPNTDSPVGQLACTLRRSRAALGLTQAQAANAIGVSTSTVQRAESGAAPPKKSIVEGYIATLGLDPDEAEQLFERATRPLGGQRRSLTQAPHPRLVSTRDELGRALSRVWEENDRPSMQTLQDRVDAVREDTTRKPFAFLSRSAAYRISHRQQLPSNIEQLRAYLHACQVTERRSRVWIQAYQRVKAKEKQEAAEKRLDTEEHALWRGHRGQRLAFTIMLEAGLHPTEAFPRSVTAPWTAQCATCHRIGRFRLSAVRQGHGCRRCTALVPRS